MFEPGQKYSRWQSVVKRHQKQIWAACRRYARDDEATLRDLVQEVCLVLWLKIDRLRPNVSAGEERLWCSSRPVPPCGCAARNISHARNASRW